MKILSIPQNPKNVFTGRGYQLAKSFIKLGHEVHFIVWDIYPADFKSILQNLASSWKYNNYMMDGVSVHKIRRLPFFCPPINGFLFKRQISQIARKEKIDIIISASFINEVIPPFDLPLIYDIWDYNEALFDVIGGKIMKFALKYILHLRKSVNSQIKHAKAIVTVSDMLVEYAKKINSQIPVYKVPNGVGSAFLESKLEKSEYDFGKHSMVYVNNFSNYSNLPKLLQATSNIKIKYPDIKLVLIGDGNPIPKAKKLAHSLGISEHVLFLGHIPYEKIPSLISGCSIAISCIKKSLHGDSSFPLKNMEYTALGKVIVTSNLEEVELLEFPNMIIYDDFKGAEELSDAIVAAFNMTVDPYETRKLMINYSWSNIARQFNNIFKELKIQ